MASSDSRRRRKLAFKVKSSSSSNGSIPGSFFVYPVFSCVDDVEHHRHRRNPFDPKYIQAALSSFEELGQDGSRNIATREDLEAASTSVHVRTELIKSMKDGLMKLTTEAIKCCGTGTKKTHKKRLSIPEMKVDMLQTGTVQREKETPDTLPRKDDYEVYKRIFGEFIGETKELPSSVLEKDCHGRTHKVNIGLSLVIKDLETCLNGNPNFVTEDEICFNLKKENMETLPEVLQRWQSGCEAVALSEDGYADLSPYKGYILPVTKELVLDVEDNQIIENAAESRLHAKETRSKSVMNNEGDFTQNVNSHVMVSASVIKEPFEIEKTTDMLDRMGCSTACYAQKPVNASGHSPFCEESVEISFGDEVMKEGIIAEDIQDDIEDEEEVQESIEAEDIQDDGYKEVAVKIMTGGSVHYTISNAEIARLLQLREKSKRSKHPWLVSDPEKLLLADNNTSGCKYYFCDLQSHIESISLDGIELFKQSLSRPGLDIIERYDSIRKDSSQVSGTLHFELTVDEEDNKFSSGMVNTDDQEVENMDVDQDRSHEFRTGTRQHDIVERSSVLALSQEEYQQSTESFWENYAWLISGHRGKDGNSYSNRYTSQHTDGNSHSNNALYPPLVAHEREHLSPLHHMSENCESDINPSADSTVVEHDVIHPMSWDRIHYRRESVQLVDYAHEKHDNTADQHADLVQKNTAVNSIQNKGTTLTLSGRVNDGKTSVWKEHNRTWQHDQKDMSINVASETICLLDGGMKEMEVFSVPRATDTNILQLNPLKESSFAEMINQENDSIDMPIYSPNTEASVAAEDVLARPHSSSGSQQASKSVKKRCDLDELIADAVKAECQLQEITYSHYDLEPLSLLLSTIIASTFQEQNGEEIIFKDLIATCRSELVTPQRCFIALLSLAHRHNMGNSKNSGKKDFQISIRKGCAGKLDEIIVHLIPVVAPIAIQHE